MGLRFCVGLTDTEFRLDVSPASTSWLMFFIGFWPAAISLSTSMMDCEIKSSEAIDVGDASRILAPVSGK